MRLRPTLTAIGGIALLLAVSASRASATSVDLYVGDTAYQGIDTSGTFSNTGAIDLPAGTSSYGAVIVQAGVDATVDFWIGTTNYGELTLHNWTSQFGNMNSGYFAAFGGFHLAASAGGTWTSGGDGTTIQATGGTVPEPGTISFLAASAAMLPLLRRRRRVQA